MNLADYTEPTYRMISPWPNPKDHSSDNGLLYTALAVKWAGFMFMTRHEYSEIVKKCCVPGSPGLLCRYPGAYGHGEDEQQDDYRAVAAVTQVRDHFFANKVSKDILTYGKNHWYYYQLPTTGGFQLNFWFGRFPGFDAVIKGGAGQKIGILSQLWFFIGCLGVLIQKDTDSTSSILQYLSCLAVEDKGVICDLGVSLWRRLSMRKFPGGMKQVMSIYFPQGHPLIDLAPDDFEYGL